MKSFTLIALLSMSSTVFSATKESPSPQMEYECHYIGSQITQFLNNKAKSGWKLKTMVYNVVRRNAPYLICVEREVPSGKE